MSDFEDSFIDFDNNECCGNPLRGCEKCPPVKKLTFEEWYQHRYAAVDFGELKVVHLRKMKECWQAAQENK